MVADGVGGRASGGPAAQAAVRAVEVFVESTARRGLREWQAFAERLDRALADDATCGETTLTVVEVTPRLIQGVSVGDSEAWLFLPNGYYDLTARQIAKPFLGSGAAIPVPFRLHRNHAGTLVVASDGLFKYTTASLIEAAARESDLTEAVTQISRLPRLRSGTLPDDLAVCVCQLSTVGSRVLLRWPFASDAEWIPSSPDTER